MNDACPPDKTIIGQSVYGLASAFVLHEDISACTQSMKPAPERPQVVFVFSYLYDATVKCSVL
ncbi:hypothetical protein BABINDRAFT_160744 [Babjeviella inositovora NRRL Y-12698]|uniref:Uncharacterized protein n=1 Tax=Babjeviella inositovora NRRL Y-12698 TaxID=984486 RepID=A0A1E3QWN2_9ASCO|nr:uncharacterized protein BABINDRAFT_160744 [Babjeviella inositovora NRRL Y-12698]ODQ81407.1 hypothetical protein BABINDRAFT_160744 [Babjeviella inositovora NRRL Y-12698]